MAMAGDLAGSAGLAAAVGTGVGCGARDTVSAGTVSAGAAEGTAELLAEAESSSTGSGRPWDGVAAWAGVVYFDRGGTGLRVAKTCKSCNCF